MEKHDHHRDECELRLPPHQAVAPITNAMPATISGKRRYANDASVRSSMWPSDKRVCFRMVRQRASRCLLASVNSRLEPGSIRWRASRQPQWRWHSLHRHESTRPFGHRAAQQQGQRGIAGHRIVFLRGREREEDQQKTGPTQRQQPHSSARDLSAYNSGAPPPGNIRSRETATASGRAKSRGGAPCRNRADSADSETAANAR